MIWNDTLLYLHVPKTGGMTVSRRLLDRLARPVYCSVPEGQYDGPSGVQVVQGTRHENLPQAVQLLARFNKRIEHFPRVIVTIRNPYEMEVSRYFYLRKDSPVDRGTDQYLAMNRNFADWVVEAPFWGKQTVGIEDWFLLEGRTPPNLVVVRQENLEKELAAALDQVGLGHVAAHLHRENFTQHDHFRTYLTPRAEEAIHRRYAWLFDSGFYERERIGT